MSVLTLQSRVRRAEEPLFAPVDQEIVMLSYEREKYFHLNSAGARIWELVESPISVGDICAELSRRYKVADEICQADVLEFLRELKARTLIDVEE